MTKTVTLPQQRSRDKYSREAVKEANKKIAQQDNSSGSQKSGGWGRKK